MFDPRLAGLSYKRGGEVHLEFALQGRLLRGFNTAQAHLCGKVFVAIGVRA
jgi:hypothetical protein